MSVNGYNAVAQQALNNLSLSPLTAGPSILQPAASSMLQPVPLAGYQAVAAQTLNPITGAPLAGGVPLYSPTTAINAAPRALRASPLASIYGVQGSAAPGAVVPRIAPAAGLAGRAGGAAVSAPTTMGGRVAQAISRATGGRLGGAAASAAEGGTGGLLARLFAGGGGGAAAANAAKAGALRRFLGGSMFRYGVAPMLADTAGDWIANQDFAGADRVGAAVEDALVAGAISRNPFVALGAGALGAATGWELEDIPLIGGLFGSNEEPPSPDEMRAEIFGNVNDLLNELNAPDIVRARVNNAIRVQWQVSGAETSEELATVAQQTVNTLLGMYAQEEAAAQQAAAIQQEQRAWQANVAAVQAWMQPMIQEQLDAANFYAQQYSDMAMASAGEIQNPGLRAASQALAAQFPVDQAANNAYVLQQMYATPDTLSQQLGMQYEQQLLALQQQQLALQEQQASMGSPSTNSLFASNPALYLSEQWGAGSGSLSGGSFGPLKGSN